MLKNKYKDDKNDKNKEDKDDKKSSKEIVKISRSVKLRKYASAYNSYMRKTEKLKVCKSPHRVRSITIKKDINTLKLKTDITPIKKPIKKVLNSYQKFVQSESKKEKYKYIPGKERLAYIANEWKKKSEK